ncbi:MAG: L-lysine exporter family protein LysE/ArgO [Oceanospirillaceae bacterium]
MAIGAQNAVPFKKILKQDLKNQHLYLDTQVLVGFISTQFSTTIVEFATGDIAASFVFFFNLGYGAGFLLPIFKNPWIGKYWVLW